MAYNPLSFNVEPYKPINENLVNITAGMIEYSTGHQTLHQVQTYNEVYFYELQSVPAYILMNHDGDNKYIPKNVNYKNIAYHIAVRDANEVLAEHTIKYPTRQYVWEFNRETNTFEKFGLIGDLDLSEYVCVTSLNSYDNSNDGKITATNQRTKHTIPILPWVRNYIGQITFQQTYYLQVYNDAIVSVMSYITPTVDQNGDTCYSNNYLTLAKSSTCGQLAYRLNYEQTPIRNKSLDNNIAYMGHAFMEGRMFSIWDTDGASPGNGGFIVTTRNAIKTLFNKLLPNLAWTFNIDEILSKNSTDFTDYVTSGQPDSGTGGGTGNGDNESDDITLTNPTITALSALNTAYALTSEKTRELGDYLWNSTYAEDLKLLFNSPSEAIVNCMMFPFDLTTIGNLEEIQTIKLGNVTTTVTGRKMPNNFTAIAQMGSIAISEYFGSALDYAPYTKIDIFLPYIGFRELNVNEVMKKTLSIKYAIDYLTGSCTAMIFANKMMVGSYQGNIGIQIPLNGTNASENAKAYVMSAISAGAGIATGGMGLAVAGIAVAKNVAGMETHIQKGGVSSPQCGLYCPNYCYITITRPLISKPAEYANINGYPSNVSDKLSAFSGYTVCENVNTENISATEQEKQQIKQILESGVYIL